MRRYPLEPLRSMTGVSKSAMQKRLGVSGSEWVRYWRDGLSVLVADRYANRLGFHPAEVWPSWVEDAEAERRRLHAEAQRKWRKTPAGRKSHRAAVARYQQATREYQTRYRRAWAAANPEKVAEHRRRDYERRGAQKNAARKARYQSDPEYRQRVLEAQRRRDAAKREAKAETTSYQNLGPTSSSTGFPPTFQGWCPSDPQVDRRRITAVGFDSRMENR